MKMLTIMFVLIFVSISTKSFAYMENYPPHLFKSGPYGHLDIKPLVDYDKSDYVSKDGKVKARLVENSDSLDFYLKVGEVTLAKMIERDVPFPYAVYEYDLDKNGLNDFIVFNSYRGVGLGVNMGKTEIYLSHSNNKFTHVSYESWSEGIEDFVDINNDGKIEVILGGCQGFGDHTFFTYNIYQIVNFKMVNANKKFKGFPKFVWYTHKPNDKDTVKIEMEERSKYVSEQDKLFNYSVK